MADLDAAAAEAPEEEVSAGFVERLILLYLYVLLFGPSLYLSEKGTEKLYLDWLVLLYALHKSRPFWPLMRWARWPLILWCANVAWVLLVSVMNSGSALHESPFAAVPYTFGALRPAMIFLAFGSLILGALSPRERAGLADRLWLHVIVVTVFFGLAAILQLFGPRAIHDFFISVWPRRDERILDADTLLVWPSVTFDGYYHVFGLFMGMMGALSLAHVADGHDRPPMWVGWLGFMLSTAVVLLSQSRGALGGLIIGVAVFLVLAGWRRAVRTVGVVVVPLILLLVMFQALQAQIEASERFNVSYAVYKLGSLFKPETLVGADKGMQDAGRIVFWQVHIAKFLANPITGSGLYRAVGDSLYLTLLGQGGLVGTSLFLGSLAGLGLGLRRLRAAAGSAPAHGRAALAAMAVLVGGSYGIGTLGGDRLGQSFYVIACVLLAAHHLLPGEEPAADATGPPPLEDDGEPAAPDGDGEGVPQG